MVSSKECVSSALFCAVISLLGMRLLVERWYINWSTGLDLQSSTRCLFLHCWCSYRFIGLGLQSSRGCVYYGIVDACYWSIGLGLSSFMRCVYFCAAGAPIDYRPWSTIIQGMRLLRHCRCMLLVYWSWSTIVHGMRLSALLVHLSIYWFRSTC